MSEYKPWSIYFVPHVFGSPNALRPYSFDTQDVMACQNILTLFQMVGFIKMCFLASTDLGALSSKLLLQSGETSFCRSWYFTKIYLLRISADFPGVNPWVGFFWDSRSTPVPQSVNLVLQSIVCCLASDHPGIQGEARVIASWVLPGCGWGGLYCLG